MATDTLIVSDVAYFGLIDGLTGESVYGYTGVTASNPLLSSMSGSISIASSSLSATSYTSVGGLIGVSTSNYSAIPASTGTGVAISLTPTIAVTPIIASNIYDTSLHVYTGTTTTASALSGDSLSGTSASIASCSVPVASYASVSSLVGIGASNYGLNASSTGIASSVTISSVPLSIPVSGTLAADNAVVIATTINTTPIFAIGNGTVATSFGSYEDSGKSVILQPDGKILVAGYSYHDILNSDFALARYNPNGSLDTSFDIDGKLITAFGGQGLSIALQTDGKVLVSGFSYNSYLSGNADFALARYNIDGSLDTTFSGDGKLTTNFGVGFNVSTGVTLQSDGKILVVGTSGSGSAFALARYNLDGNLDTSFDGDGMLTTGLGSNASASSVVLQSDGKILVAGTVGSNNSDIALDSVVTRYLPTRRCNECGRLQGMTKYISRSASQFLATA